MAYSDELCELRNLYYACLRGLNKTASDLSNSIKSINSMIALQGSCYSVNDVSGGSNYLNYLLEKENNIYSNIVNNIIPDTNRIIDDVTFKN